MAFVAFEALADHDRGRSIWVTRSRLSLARTFARAEPARRDSPAIDAHRTSSPIVTLAPASSIRPTPARVPGVCAPGRPCPSARVQVTSTATLAVNV